MWMNILFLGDAQMQAELQKIESKETLELLQRLLENIHGEQGKKYQAVLEGGKMVIISIIDPKFRSEDDIFDQEVAFKCAELDELRKKIGSPFLPDDFKPLSREEANED